MTLQLYAYIIGFVFFLYWHLFSYLSRKKKILSKKKNYLDKEVCIFS
jgi:hypothetical protein